VPMITRLIINGLMDFILLVELDLGRNTWLYVNWFDFDDLDGAISWVEDANAHAHGRHKYHLRAVRDSFKWFMRL